MAWRRGSDREHGAGGVGGGPGAVNTARPDAHTRAEAGAERSREEGGAEVPRRLMVIINELPISPERRAGCPAACREGPGPGAARTRGARRAARRGAEGTQAGAQVRAGQRAAQTRAPAARAAPRSRRSGPAQPGTSRARAWEGICPRAPSPSPVTGGGEANGGGPLYISAHPARSRTAPRAQAPPRPLLALRGGSSSSNMAVEGCSGRCRRRGERSRAPAPARCWLWQMVAAAAAAAATAVLE